MPRITLNLAALAHNQRLTAELGRRWNFTLLPVLKMVACHPVVANALLEMGHPCFGAADVDEPRMHETRPAADAAFINIAPPDRADEVVSLFRRSAVSGMAGMRALDEAAKARGVIHDVLLMVDIGDLREGVPAAEAAPLAESMARAGFRHARLRGVGVTMGCLYGACPDEAGMALLMRATDEVEAAFGRPLDLISLGGSIFLDWFARYGRSFQPGSGRTLEFRAGDPLLLGFDMYRNRPFPGGDFRCDLFTLEATVLESREKKLVPPRVSVRNGQGRERRPLQSGVRRRVLLDCGTLHTDVRELTLDLPGAKIVDFSGNYSILDVTDCPSPPAVGDAVVFRPGYWAVARAFRTPLVQKRFVP